jgi:hypothetical protein
VTVFYPLNPLFGRELPVFRRYGAGGTSQVEVKVDGERQGIPVWMTDENLCAEMTSGFVPSCSLTSLFEFRALLLSSEL